MREIAQDVQVATSSRLDRDWMSHKIATCEEHMQEGEESNQLSQQSTAYAIGYLVPQVATCTSRE